MEKIERLTKDLHESTHSDNFEIFKRLHSETYTTLKEKIVNKIFLSIGGGKSDTMLNIAREGGAKIFVNVDKENYGKESDDFAKYVVVNAEDFLLGLESSGAYCVEVSGIDEVSYDGDFEALANSIYSKMSQGAVVFGVNSDPLLEIFRKKHFNTVFDDGRYFIFEKR